MRFDVRVDMERSQQFNESISLDQSDRVEQTEEIAVTYPACWLALPEIKQAVLTRLGISEANPSHTLVHLEQTFDYSGALAGGINYRLELLVHRADAQSRCRLTAKVVDPDSNSIVEMSGTFLLVELASKIAL